MCCFRVCQGRTKLARLTKFDVQLLDCTAGMKSAILVLADAATKHLKRRAKKQKQARKLMRRTMKQKWARAATAGYVHNIHGTYCAPVSYYCQVP